jgi:hypothetical protein
MDRTKGVENDLPYCEVSAKTHEVVSTGIGELVKI